MKKLILLALVALVAGAAFAETAPAFSGSFEFSTTMDFDAETYTVGATNDASVNLNGVVSDYSTVTAELAVAEKDLEDTFNATVELNQFNLETDITGALGVDGPVGVSLAWGLVSHEAAEYNGVAGYDDVEPTSETDSYWGTRMTVTIVEKVKLIALIPPATYTDWTVVNGNGGDAVISLEAQFLGLIEGLDFNVWYTDDPNAATVISEAGFTAGYTMGDLALGALLKANLDTEVTGAGIAVAYTVADMLTAGAVFGIPDFSDFDVAYLGLNGTYHAVADMLDIFAAVSMPFADISDTLGFEGGLVFMLAGVDYTVGYDYNGVGFQSPNGQGLFFSVTADF